MSNEDPFPHILPQENIATVSSSGKSTLMLFIVLSLCYLNFYSFSSNLMLIVPSPYLSVTVLSHSPTVKCSLNQSVGFQNCFEFRLNSILSPFYTVPVTKGKMKTLILSGVQAFPTTKDCSSGVELIQMPSGSCFHNNPIFSDTSDLVGIGPEYLHSNKWQLMSKLGTLQSNAETTLQTDSGRASKQKKLL